MSFRGPNAPLISAMASMMGSSMAPQPYHQMQGMQPMAGLLPMQMLSGMPPMGVTVPSGVTTISAPPVRNITLSSNPSQSASPSLLGVYPGANPMFQQMAAATHDNGSQFRKPKPSPGQTITVFVGNITDRASDMLIRQLLSKCGTVNNWKRVQGANGKLQAFGFCEYCDQESAMRAVRLLLDFEVADKKLVVKVDPKTQEKLDEYTRSKGQIGKELDHQTKEEDSHILQQLYTVLKEHEIELSKEPDLKERQRRYNTAIKDPTKPENLSEMDLEDDKRSLIHREIDKFRDTYKKLEDEKEKELLLKKKKDEDKPSKEDELKPNHKSNRERSPRDREKQLDDRDRPSRRENSRRDRDRDRDRDREQRERERDRERDRDRDRDRYRDRRSETKEPLIEDEEEAYERRRLERQMKEKEASYQRRLREWEQREMRKSKDFEKEKLKEERKRAEEEDEKRKLKEFLEDYDDDRFDHKYYKGNSLMRRMREREKEIVSDENDRQQEKKELDELREKLAQEGHPDPDSEVRKRLLSEETERDRNNRVVSDRIRALMLEARQKSGSGVTADDDISMGSNDTPKEEPVKTFGFAGMKLQNTLNSISNTNSNVNNGTDKTSNNLISNTNTPDSIDTTTTSGHAVTNNSDLKRKKLSVSEVFNPNEDDDITKKKKRKLPTLLDDNTDSNLSTPSAKNSAAGLDKTLSSEEKRRQIKALIEKIPTSKEELFKYEIEWSLVDNTLMERRIRPWINKKIAEYIGEEELALLDFICNKLQSNSSAQSILDDVAMVLDDEAEVFVVKMWRLLIYEIEAKKLGLGK